MQIELAHRPVQASTARVSWPLRLPLRLTLDILLIALGFWFAYLLRYEREFGGVLEEADRRPFRDFLPLICGLAALFLAVAGARGLYRLSRWSGLLDEARIILHSAIAAFGTLIIVAFYSRQFYFSRLVFLYALLFVVAQLVPAA
jgi:FlaA1/EpsC-like NDP-sugar epimerase